MIIAVDFDGTLCTNKWPDIGDPNEALIGQLIEAQKSGSKLILWSCRNKKDLAAAVKWAKGQGLTFDAVNQNLPERIKKYKNDSRKVSADLYIDDRAAGFSFGQKVEVDLCQ